FVIAPVEVVDARYAEGLGGSLKRVENLPMHAHLLDAPFSARAMHVVGAAVIVLGFPEIGKHIVPAPAGAAHLAPKIIVARLAAHIDHAVDGGATAKHLAAGIAK